MLKFGELEGRLNLPLTIEMQWILEDIMRFTCRPNGNIPAAGMLDPGSLTEQEQPVDKSLDWQGYGESFSSPKQAFWWEPLPPERGWTGAVPISPPAHYRDLSSETFRTGHWHSLEYKQQMQI